MKTAHQNSTYSRSHTDVLILGSGGAGLLAAIHAYDSNPKLSITVASKGLIGKSGCTRMVQGGYNVVLSEGDSVEAHFQDTIEGGKWINDQELAWTLVTKAIERIYELENQHGCFFDRNLDGTVHQKAFAGQTFDRTVHKGDLTGIEIMNRLSEQVRVRGIHRLEECRAYQLIPDLSGARVAGVLFIDMRTGNFNLIQAKSVVIATGAGPTMYKFHTPSGDKSCDGLALALRFGLSLRDMEMVQFHPTGLLAGTGTRITGTIIEEGLRGAGGYLLDKNGRRFMLDYDSRAERATRDIVSRAMLEQMRQGICEPNGGVFICMNHLDSNMVRKQFKGMVKRCADLGMDLVLDPVEVTPTAHYIMGGIEINTDCSTSIPGLFAAGEDTGGVHGANRLGGNGVANSTVFGGIAGETAARWATENSLVNDFNHSMVESSIDQALLPFAMPEGDLNQIREDLYEMMWEDAGILRSKQSLAVSVQNLHSLETKLADCGIGEDSRVFNMKWHEYLNLQNLILVSQAIVAAALTRNDSRGAHFLQDYPKMSELNTSRYTQISLKENKIYSRTKKVEFTRIQPNTFCNETMKT